MTPRPHQLWMSLSFRNTTWAARAKSSWASALATLRAPTATESPANCVGWSSSHPIWCPEAENRI